ncbi:MAG: hypothetical protein ACRENO_00125 [Thermodesulfobacteriota bacterium]
MNLHGKSVLSWVIAFSFVVMVMGIIPKTIQTVWAHGDQLGADDDEHGGAEKEVEKGPHGGHVLVTGDNHIEFSADHTSGEIVLFLLDKNLKAISMPESYSGVVYLTMADGSKKTVNLERGTEGPVSHLEAETEVKEIGPFKAVVSLKNGEELNNFRFNWSPDSHKH